MNIPAILRGAVLIFLLATGVLLGAWFFGIEKATAPQIITLTALWIWPAILTGKRVQEAGALHGMLAGLLGGALLYLLLPAIAHLTSSAPLATTLTTESRPLLLILAGWWGAFGGLLADNRRLIQARRAARQQRHKND